MDVIKLIYKDHDKWINTIKKMGCNEETAKDLVQEMYIKIHLLITNGIDIMYNDTEINYYYIHRTLQTLFLDLKRKEKKVHYVNVEDYMAVTDPDHIDAEKAYNDMQEDLSKMHWYDKKIFEMIDSGQSISDLSRQTNISYYSLRNTYKRVQRYLRKKTLNNQ